MCPPESFDLWTWAKCQEKLRTLPGRLGFPTGNVLQFLGLELDLTTGTVTDKVLQRRLDPLPPHFFFPIYRYAEAQTGDLEGKLISFREVEGGRMYTGKFNLEAADPIAHSFGQNLQHFEQAAKRLNGKRIMHGDIAYTISALPLIPYTYILWEGDDEFPAKVSVLMDQSVDSLLDAEAITYLAGITTQRLVKIGKE
jgi:hypothetical protein